MTISISPTNEHPLPQDFKDEIGASLQENARVAASTAALMNELGMPFEMTDEDERAARELFKQVDVKKGRKVPPESYNPPSLYTGAVAIKLSALLNEYDKRVVLDATQARTYIMNRLLEISSCGDTKNELRALELMGKMSDVGAFSEKSEITITHRTSDDLKNAIQQKIQRLLSGSTIDVTPTRSIEEELGLLDTDESTGTTEPTENSTDAS